MKILFIHNRYQYAGGEDAVLDAEYNLLCENGHEVLLAEQDNHSIHSFMAKAKAFKDVAYSTSAKSWLKKKIEHHQPNVVHVHNFFPLLSPSIYDACIESEVPVVQTLHNYRTICPGAMLMRQGKVCEKCVEGSAYQAVLHRCYKNSVMGTIAVARMVEQHRAKGTWQNKVNRFIALTQFAQHKFVTAGFPADKICVKPNFATDPQTNQNMIDPVRKGALFVGRLSAEKGVSTLLSAWRELNVPLRIAGTGPLDKACSGLSQQSVTKLGMLDKQAVEKEMSQAEFLIMPSEWYEGFPMVLVEAFSQGLPVLASRLGGMEEIIEDGVTGLHFEAGNAADLAEKVNWMRAHPEQCSQMGRNARARYLEKYTPEKNYDMLMNIYQEAINDA